MDSLRCEYIDCAVAGSKPIFRTPGDYSFHEECYYEGLSRSGVPFTPPLISRTEEMSLQLEAKIL
ncbi:hypothetical protein LCGC14_0918900 [marine sediment metagenome]|uniref:Uncharacterized protein n=1 Tax=marine sediment metagenome TaxID=412755 RepID=A0A0F9NW76_9ZZZZ